MKASNGALCSGGLPAAIVTNTDSATDPTNATSYSFASKSIGSASAGRYIVVCVSLRSAVSASAVTVAGQSCSKVIEQLGTFAGSSIWITDAPVTSGTTATVAITCGSAVACGIGLYALTNLTSNAATATASAVADGTTMSPSVTGGGVAIMAEAADGGPFTAHGLTQDYNLQSSDTTLYAGAAHGSYASSQTLSVFCNSSNNPAYTCATFR